MAKRRTPEEIERSKAARLEKKLRKKHTEWISWGATRYYMFTECSKPDCKKMAYCRGKHRDSMVCKECHFGSEENERSSLLRSVSITA